MKEDVNLKRSLCRYYLRGLCTFQQQECLFAHGIQDLDYCPRQFGEEIEYDYLRQTEFTQRNTLKGPRIYINLYEFQPQKKYTLQQLNDEKQLRVEVRNQMHQLLFHDFMKLLQATYPETNFTEEFLLQEYTRVGFNKLMTRIKFSHLTDALCQGENARYFLKAIVMPPYLKQTQNFLFKRPPTKEIIDCYRKECENILKENDYKLDQAQLKKRLFNRSYFDGHFPTLSQILKERKTGFSQFLKQMNCNQQGQLMERISLESTSEEIAAVACKYIDSVDELLSWGDLFKYLSKKLKINNGNILNQVKHELVRRGYYLFFFPMTQFITRQDHSYPFRVKADFVCQCSYKQPFDIPELSEEGEQREFVLQEGISIDISNWDSLINCAKHILTSKVLGVDLEGRLRKGGFIETVQLSNARNTFIIDLYILTVQKDIKTLQLAKKVLRNVFVDKNILKVFHDCRHDSLALHQCLNTCVLNTFDTSAIQTMKAQIYIYYKQKESVHDEKQKQKNMKNAVSQCSNVRAIGLNEIYQRYQASHGINKSKERFHKMWKEGEVDFFLQRPMDPDYRDYCIRDVLDLPEVYEKMESSLPKWCIDQGKWVSANYVSYGYQNSAAFQTQTKKCQQ